MKNGSWLGWEYETPNGLHMVISKRHYFLPADLTAVCGRCPPVWLGASKNEGDYACRVCERWCEKNEPGALT